MTSKKEDREPKATEWIVCFGGEDWWYHSHGHFDIQLMKRFSTAVNVLYVCSIGMRMPSIRNDRLFLTRLRRKLSSVMHRLQRVHRNLHVFSPLPIPLYGSRSGRLVNTMALRLQLKSICRRLKIESPIVWINTPTAWPIARTLPRRGLVYQRTDDYAAYDFDNFNAAYVKQVDTDLVKGADLVIHVSEELHQEAVALTNNSVLVTQGVDERFFGSQSLPPRDLQGIPRPIVGYIGGMDRYKFSTDVVEAVARELSNLSFVFVGQRNPNVERLSTLRNVHFLGMKDHSEIPAYVHAFDVCIVPTAQTDWGMKCRPLKLMEYLAAGKPVVATETPASLAFGDAITVANSLQSWVEGILDALPSRADNPRSPPNVTVHLESWNSLAARFWKELHERGLSVNSPQQFAVADKHFEGATR